MPKELNLKQLMDRLKVLLANKDAKVFVVDPRERYYRITNVDTVFADEVVIDIERIEETEFKL